MVKFPIQTILNHRILQSKACAFESDVSTKSALDHQPWLGQLRRRNITVRLQLRVTWPQQQVLCCPLTHNVSVIQGQSHAVLEGTDVVISGAFGVNNRVHDVDRYRICRNDARIYLHCHAAGTVGGDANGFEDIVPQNEFHGDTLVVVLESPHKDEYNGNSIDAPIAPAQGDTGRILQRQLCNVIRLCPHLDADLSEGTRAILCNPIQFQTSLVAVIEAANNWRKVRNAVWRRLWSTQMIRDNFLYRLQQYQPNYIINACTVGLGGNIDDFLRDGQFAAVRKYCTYHPSFWDRGRKLTHL